MTHDENLRGWRAWCEELAERGLEKNNALGWFSRRLISFGFRVPPSEFRSWPFDLAVNALLFAVAWFLAHGLILLVAGAAGAGSEAPVSALWWSPLKGAIVGVLLTFPLRALHRGSKRPSWEAYCHPDAASTPDREGAQALP